MEKISLKLGEILQLESEINGFNNPETGEQIYKGFLKQNLSIILKYELTELGETLSKERKKVEKLRDELIVKYGEENESGSVMVKMVFEEKDENGEVISTVINPKYIEFDNEYGTLLNQEKEIEYPEITKEDLREAGKTNDKYTILFKLIKK
jgi:hypothetical protein